MSKRHRTYKVPFEQTIQWTHPNEKEFLKKRFLCKLTFQVSGTVYYDTGEGLRKAKVRVLDKGKYLIMIPGYHIRLSAFNNEKRCFAVIVKEVDNVEQ